MAPQQNASGFDQLGVAATPAPSAPASSGAAPAATGFDAIGVAATPTASSAAATPPATTVDPLAGHPAAQAVEGARQFAAPIWGAVKPPETPTEQVIHGVAGPGGLIAYRASKGIYDAAANLVKATPETFSAAVRQMNQASDEFHKGHYGAAAADAAGAITTSPLNPPPVNDVKELIHGAQTGNVITPLVRQGLTGAVAAIAPEATEGAAAEEAPSAFRRLIVNPFRKLVATPAEAGEAAETAAGTAGAREALQAGNRSLLATQDVETPLQQAKNLYQTVDKAAGTNIKEMYDKLENAQDRVMQTVDGSAEEAKALADVKAQEDAIAQVKQRAEQAGVPNVDKVLKQADAKFTEAQANKEFNYKFQPAINGDVAHGAAETVDVDKAISIARKMSQPTVKYPTPRLYQTTIGKEGTDQLLNNLYAAKKAGEKAVEVQQVRQWWLGAAKATAKVVAPVALGAAGVAGYEALKH